MTTPAIPEQLDEVVYDLVLKRKSSQWIAYHLWEVHRVKASRSAVTSCFARAKKEKRTRLYDLTDGVDGLDGGSQTLDRLFRESQAFALEAVEGHQLHAGLRAIDQQLRILKLHQAQLRAEAVDETQTAPFTDPANTLQPPTGPEENQGVSAILQGVKNHPAAPRSHPGTDLPTPFLSTPARPSPGSAGEGGGAATPPVVGSSYAAPRVRVASPDRSTS